MAVAITQLVGPFGTLQVRITNINNAATTLAAPTTGSIYTIGVTNPNLSPVYLKFADTLSATVGTTPASTVITVPGGTDMGGGIINPRHTTTQFGFRDLSFVNGFSAWCVTGASEASAVSPASAVTASFIIGG